MAPKSVCCRRAEQWEPVGLCTSCGCRLRRITRPLFYAGVGWSLGLVGGPISSVRSICSDLGLGVLLFVFLARLRSALDMGGRVSPVPNKKQNKKQNVKRKT